MEHQAFFRMDGWVFGWLDCWLMIVWLGGREGEWGGIIMDQLWGGKCVDKIDSEPK